MELFSKTIDVINSCKTPKQLKAARNYADLAFYQLPSHLATRVEKYYMKKERLIHA